MSELKIGDKLYHWRYGTLTIENVDSNYFYLAIDDMEKINEIIGDNWNKFLYSNNFAERGKKTFQCEKKSLGIWLFENSDDVYKTNIVLGGNQISIIEFLSKLHNFFDKDLIKEKRKNLFPLTKDEEKDLQAMQEYKSIEFEVKEEEESFFKSIIGIVENNIGKIENLINFEKQLDRDDKFAPTPNVLPYYENLGKLKSIREQPYFSRIDLKGNKYYIGKNSFDDKVIPWTNNEIAKYYYQRELYANDKSYGLSLVRKFMIEKGLYYYFENLFSKYDKRENIIQNSIIKDKIMLEIIKASRETKEVHDIIQTIAKNQYDMITFAPNKNILIKGCAGSGKTMIMLHRLSHMIYNNKDIKLKDVYIISPTKLLNIESNELSKMLNINLSNKFSLLQFNIDTIKKYYNNFNNRSDIEFTNIISNFYIQNNFIYKVYTKEFIDSFRSKISDIIEFNNNIARDEFIKNENINLLKKYNDFIYDESLITNSILETFKNNTFLNNCLKDYEDLKNTFKKVSVENVKATISDYKEQIRKNVNDKTLLNKKTLLENLLNSNYKFSGKTVFSSENSNNKKVSYNDKVFGKLYRFFDVMGSNNKEIFKKAPKLKEKFKDQIDLMDKYYYMSEKIKRFEAFCNGNVKWYYFEIIEYIIKIIKENENIITNNIYEFELFLHLISCNHFFGELSKTKIYILFDEFQDYSINEFNLYKKIFPNSIINLFGDFNQCINIKGINSNEIKLLKNEDWGDFEINENYRNASEITEFLNNEFNMKMLPIGINGKLDKVKLSNIVFESVIDKRDRVALIIKDALIYQNLLKNKLTNLDEDINLVFDDENNIKSGYINVLPVNLAKGLEFEKVYVVPTNMTDNEKYVAFTRALNELIIIE